MTVCHTSLNLVYDRKLDTRPRCYAEVNRTELIVYISKCEAEVTNNKRLHSKYCAVEANYRQTRSITRETNFYSWVTGSPNLTIPLWKNPTSACIYDVYVALWREGSGLLFLAMTNGWGHTAVGCRPCAADAEHSVLVPPKSLVLIAVKKLIAIN